MSRNFTNIEVQKKNVNIFIDIFEVKDHPICYAWALPLIGGDTPFLGIPPKSQGGVSPTKQNLPPKKCFPTPREGGYLFENANFYF